MDDNNSDKNTVGEATSNNDENPLSSVIHPPVVRMVETFEKHKDHQKPSTETVESDK